MSKKEIREDYIRQVALSTIVDKMNDNDVDFILENVSTQKIEKHLRKRKIEKIENGSEINDRQELERCLEFLDFFDVSYKGDVVELSDGGNSCIMNPNTQWKEFLGYSVNSIAEAVARKLNKKTKWIY